MLYKYIYVIIYIYIPASLESKDTKSQPALTFTESFFRSWHGQTGRESCVSSLEQPMSQRWRLGRQWLCWRQPFFSPNWTVAVGYSHLCFLFSEKKNYRSELKHLQRYPLVNCHKKRTGKIQHFSWENPLWLDWAVSSWGFQTNGSKSFSLWLGVGTPSDCFDCFSGWKPTTGG